MLTVTQCSSVDLPVVHSENTVGETDYLQLLLTGGRGEVIETKHVVSEGEHKFVDVWHYCHSCDPSQFR